MELETGTETVRAEMIDGVGVVTLNRPERRNALHADMYEAIPPLLDRFVADPDVGCIMITGAGRAFCAGGDVQDGARRTEAPAVVRANGDPGAGLTRNARMVLQLHHCPKVTIAALPGAAVGAGLSIALSTDLRIAARSAKLLTGWGNLAFSGDFGGTWFLTRLVGPSKALELLVDGTSLDADAARALGLVNRVVDDDDLPGAAREWARTIAAGPRATWALMKENIADTAHLPLAEFLPRESERMVRSGQTDDHRAAVRRWLAEAAAKRR